MAISHIGRLLRQRVERQQQDLMFGAFAGKVEDFAEFKYFVGYVQGLKWAIEELERIENEGS